MSRQYNAGGVYLVTSPVLGTPKFHHINCLELMFESVMQCLSDCSIISYVIIFCPMVLHIGDCTCVPCMGAAQEVMQQHTS